MICLIGFACRSITEKGPSQLTLIYTLSMNVDIVLGVTFNKYWYNGMTINVEDFAPYLSGVLFHCESSDEKLVSILRKRVEKALRADTGSARNKTDKSRQFQKVEPETVSSDGYHCSALHYSEAKRPAWYLKDDLKDRLNHVVVISGRGKFVSITFSDPAARNLIVKEIKVSSQGAFGKLSLLSSIETENALVESEVRTLWLSGTHRQSAIKPDSKQLSGLELESAIDPVDDQSYYFSSIRSTLDDNDLAIEGRNVVVGTSPKHGRFWISPTRSWDDFSERMDALLKYVSLKLSGVIEAKEPLAMLAKPVTSVSGVETPYGVTLIVPEAQLADVVHDDDEKWFQQFADAVTFELDIEDGSPNFEADVFWSDKKLGRLAYEFVERDGIDIGMLINVLDWPGEEERDIAFRNICTQPTNTTVYFDTGHTFSRGHIYETRFRDPRFRNWMWIKMASDNTEFGKEKPNKMGSTAFDATRIGAEDDRSLFGLMARHWPNLKDRGNATGWLVCDDGAMESADFIHIDDKSEPPKVSLIHVKGSGNKKKNRSISVSDYEVVIGQAVKNVRYLDQQNLYEKLAGNTDVRIQDAVWKDGVRQEDRAEVLEVIKSLGSRYETEVFVLQPRVRKTVLEKTLDKIAKGDQASPDVLRLKQLDGLLQAAATDCFAVNARFTVIADDDV